MNVELSTTIKIKGTSEDLLSMLKALKEYEVKYSGPYKGDFVGTACVDNGEKECYVYEMNTEEMAEFLSAAGGEVLITSDGLFNPRDCNLFETLAEAAPQASFEGCIEADGDETHDVLDGDFKDGILSLDLSYLDGAEDYEETEELIEKCEKKIYDPVKKSYKK